MQLFRQRSSNQIDLAESSFAAVLTTQPHGHDHIHSHACTLAVHYCCQAIGEPFSQWLNLRVLQEPKRARQSAFITPVAARELKTESPVNGNSLGNSGSKVAGSPHMAQLPGGISWNGKRRLRAPRRAGNPPGKSHS